jgi:protein-disulfide isomerase
MQFLLLASLSSAILMPIPRRYPGILWGPPNAVIKIELFADPLCPDCATIWPKITAVLNHYPTQVNVDVHFLPLPYHTWAFVVTRGILAANISSPDKARQMLANLYAGDQSQFSNTALQGKGQDAVLTTLASYVQSKLAISASEFTANYNRDSTDTLGRVEFKYSASRGNNGTPVVYVNAVESSIDESTPLATWYAIIDGLLS